MYLFDGGWKRKKEREVDVSSRMNNRRLVRAVVVCVSYSWRRSRACRNLENANRNGYPNNGGVEL